MKGKEWTCTNNGISLSSLTLQPSDFMRSKEEFHLPRAHHKIYKYNFDLNLNLFIEISARCIIVKNIITDIFFNVNKFIITIIVIIILLLLSLSMSLLYVYFQEIL